MPVEEFRGWYAAADLLDGAVSLDETLAAVRSRVGPIGPIGPTLERDRGRHL